jgi:hypothetical protein
MAFSFARRLAFGKPKVKSSGQVLGFPLKRSQSPREEPEYI